MKTLWFTIAVIAVMMMVSVVFGSKKECQEEEQQDWDWDFGLRLRTEKNRDPMLKVAIEEMRRETLNLVLCLDQRRNVKKKNNKIGIGISD